MDDAWERGTFVNERRVLGLIRVTILLFMNKPCRFEAGGLKTGENFVHCITLEFTYVYIALLPCISPCFFLCQRGKRGHHGVQGGMAFWARLWFVFFEILG